MSRVKILAGTAMLALALAAGSASAVVPVYVGYADGLRGGAFFPVPFLGDPNVVAQSGNFISDNGAVRIDNTTGAPLVISNFTYTINFDGPQTIPDLTIPVGGIGIFILTDTSDQSFIPGATYGSLATGCAVECPKVSFSENGVPVGPLNDSGHVLDTGGFDFAANGSNESFQWRLIGTVGGQAGAPEPSAWVVMLLGIGLAGGAIRRRSRNAVASAA